MIQRILTRAKRTVPSPLAALARRGRLVRLLVRDPGAGEQMAWLARGLAFTRRWARVELAPVERPGNPSRAFFDARSEGRAIWKWDHYFDMYDNHLRRFRGTDVRVVEIGVSGGGSLEMWRHYLGDACLVYGVDIDETCWRFEDDATRIFIGDQADPAFWRRFRAAVPDVESSSTTEDTRRSSRS